MSWVSVGVAVGSAVANGVAGDKLKKEQTKGLLEAGAHQQASREQAQGVISGLLGKIGGSNPEAYAALSKQQFMDQILGNRGRIESSIPGIAGASSRYAGDVAAGKTGSMDFATRLSGLMARINAPERQRQQEATDESRAASQINQIGDFAGGNAGVDEMRLKSLQVSPWLGVAEKGAQFLGNAFARDPNGLSGSQNKSIWDTSQNASYIPSGPAVAAIGG